jgi:hypothetical protein
MSESMPGFQAPEEQLPQEEQIPQETSTEEIDTLGPEDIVEDRPAASEPKTSKVKHLGRVGSWIAGITGAVVGAGAMGDNSAYGAEKIPPKNPRVKAEEPRNQEPPVEMSKEKIKEAFNNLASDFEDEKNGFKDYKIEYGLALQIQPPGKNWVMFSHEGGKKLLQMNESYRNKIAEAEEKNDEATATKLRQERETKIKAQLR